MAWEPSRKWLEELVANVTVTHGYGTTICVLHDERSGDNYKLICSMYAKGSSYVCRRIQAYGPHPKRRKGTEFMLSSRIRDALIMAAWPEWSPPPSWDRDNEH